MSSDDPKLAGWRDCVRQVEVRLNEQNEIPSHIPFMHIQRVMFKNHDCVDMVKRERSPS